MRAVPRAACCIPPPVETEKLGCEPLLSLTTCGASHLTSLGCVFPSVKWDRSTCPKGCCEDELRHLQSRSYNDRWINRYVSHKRLSSRSPIQGKRRCVSKDGNVIPKATASCRLAEWPALGRTQTGWPSSTLPMREWRPWADPGHRLLPPRPSLGSHTSASCAPPEDIRPGFGRPFLGINLLPRKAGKTLGWLVSYDQGSVFSFRSCRA